MDFMPANSANGFCAGFGNEGMNDGSDFVASPGGALVTGAASGIGRKIAARLALARYSVVVHCSLASRATAEAAAASFKEQGGEAGVLAADLREPDALARLAADAAAIGDCGGRACFSRGTASLSGTDGGVHAGRSEAYRAGIAGNHRA
jgi:NAD(P)-dependent dehydrogenase (short-subunit alcohol dehydrogenase family)